MRIAVFGIGYVGAVAAACLARDGHDVVAVDVNQAKVDALLAKQSPIVEPQLDTLIASAVDEGRLRGTTSAKDAIDSCDMSFVCVGTPARANGSLDTSYVERVCEDIGRALAERSGFHSVVVRSTILPNTMDSIVIPRLEAASGRRAGEDFGIAYYPEFLREGSAIADYDKPGAIVFGRRDQTTLDRLLDLHKQFPVQPQVLSLKAAEAIKYTNNAWHALKISFANEIGLICKSLDVDSHEVMNVLVSDTKLNISPAYLKPGYAFGGSCLPKDVKALRYRAGRQDVDTPILDGILEANENQIRKAFRMATASGHRRIGLIGLSFKPETDDLRYSPFVELAERLIGRGYKVRIFDPIVQPARLTGSNKAYLSEQLPHINDILMDDVHALVDESDVVVIGNRKEAEPVVAKLTERGVEVIDLVRVSADRVSDGAYQGLCW
ncbi:nucleotide sugar dehydrogenase [Aureimonas jatrophae]|uniref:UDP-glucose 6-dehydrogenase n=1 Tax=Aureimonas jatrophae TaxID=1166073 RepID=A0A1H0NC78_9HYPH|nr:nucleotide sugar dehydrogenase [Aureimonas jatrophae]MBB3951185.1 GDP-mannose 6-dehydrogenase [Aureimonas jatrophae]SDO90261.1 GDP-mannose 6-dehydrogenase [Aureimonas jatrophae]